MIETSGPDWVIKLLCGKALEKEVVVTLQWTYYVL